MGKILNGILGGFSGKVGPVVGGKWKDIDYMRSYVVPANPNTPNQQTVRAKFKKLVEFGRVLIPALLSVYWDPFLSGMSGFNKWISLNYSKLQTGNVLNETAVMCKGTLEPTSTVTGTYSSIPGTVTTTWNHSVFGNGELTDNVAVVIYDKVNGHFWIDVGHATRNSTNVVTTITTNLTAANVYVYVFFYRGTGSDFIVSDSQGDQCA